MSDEINECLHCALLETIEDWRYTMEVPADEVKEMTQLATCVGDLFAVVQERHGADEQRDLLAHFVRTILMRAAEIRVPPGAFGGISHACH